MSNEGEAQFADQIYWKFFVLYVKTIHYFCFSDIYLYIWWKNSHLIKNQILIQLNLFVTKKSIWPNPKILVKAVESKDESNDNESGANARELEI